MNKTNITKRDAILALHALYYVRYHQVDRNNLDKVYSIACRYGIEPDKSNLDKIISKYETVLSA